MNQMGTMFIVIVLIRLEVKVFQKKINAESYNITLDRKKVFKGWYAIKSETGEEYLIERSFSLSSNWQRNLYKVDDSLDRYLITNDNIKSHFNVMGIGIALALSALLRFFIPINVWFGQTNNTLNIITGLSNILLMITVVVVWIICVIQLRRLSIKRVFPSLRKVGKVTLTTPLQVLKNGQEFW